MLLNRSRSHGMATDMPLIPFKELSISTENTTDKVINNVDDDVNSDADDDENNNFIQD